MHLLLTASYSWSGSRGAAERQEYTPDRPLWNVFFKIKYILLTSKISFKSCFKSQTALKEELTSKPCNIHIKLMFKSAAHQSSCIPACVVSHSFFELRVSLLTDILWHLKKGSMTRLLGSTRMVSYTKKWTHFALLLLLLFKKNTPLGQNVQSPSDRFTFMLHLKVAGSLNKGKRRINK